MPTFSRPQLIASGALVLLVLGLAGRWLLAHGSGGGPAAAARTATRAAAAPAGVAVRTTARRVVVHVAGAVRRPGVYELDSGARVQDAVRRAGGTTSRGDVDAINLAAPVQDGVRIVVPQRVAAGSGAAAAAPAASAGTGPAAGTPAAGGEVPQAPVDLNTATAEQLDTLDGVGPATAAKIVEYRNAHGGFRSVDDLDQIPGIGPKKLAALRTRVTT